jgi:hypothetical protein
LGSHENPDRSDWPDLPPWDRNWPDPYGRNRGRSGTAIGANPPQGERPGKAGSDQAANGNLGCTRAVQRFRVTYESAQAGSELATLIDGK